jgi:cyclophilin family peptidyl-prolyl cis-trans isomerase/HEAT repeat protein
MVVRFTSFCILILLISCIPASESDLYEKPLSFKDQKLKTILDYQNDLKVDSLTSLFDDKNSFIRAHAAKALGSMKIPGSAFRLKSLLEDESLLVRKNAAFSIGQIGGVSSESELISAFIRKDSTVNLNNEFNSAVLESIGKVGGVDNLKNIATVSTYSSEDDQLLLGQARAIYQYALRDIYDQTGSDKMLELLNNTEGDEKVRLYAANYFYRAKSIDIEPYKFQLLKILQSDPSVDIQMACAAALGKTKNQEVGKALTELLDKDIDHRVKANVIRALSNFDYRNLINPMIKLLQDPRVQIAELAANYIYQNGNARDIKLYREQTANNFPWEVKSGLYKAILRHIPNRYVNTRSILSKEIDELYAASNIYGKAAYIRAMGEDVLNYKSIISLYDDNMEPVLKTAIVEALKSSLSSPKWNYAYNTPGKNRFAKGEIVAFLSEIATNGDSGQLAVIGELMADKTLNLRALNMDYSFLEKSIVNLELPQELETYNFLVKAINYVKDTTMQEINSTNTSGIRWNLLTEISDSTSATIRTSRGDIVMMLKPSAAPSTVSNFIHLAQENFYDGKVFHRIVPNFVIQGGCPRGDGYGSLEYTIQTEISPDLRYESQGMVGMASAGNHTESSQFFITHSPALHLNGNYTIFAEVIEGMDVVNTIRVGDKISDVIINTL